MPNTREKLVEIMADLDCNAEYCKDCEFGNDIDGCVRRQKEIIADRLIANGVTVHPCEVGQKIWLVFTPKYPANPNDKGRWFIQQDGVQRIIYGVKGVSIETWNMGTNYETYHKTDGR